MRQDEAHERYIAFEHDNGQLKLPWLEISRRYRLAPGITLAMKERWGLTGVFTPIPVFGNRARQTDLQYRVMECLEAQDPSTLRLCWKPCSTLSAASFSDPQDFEAIRFILDHGCRPAGSDAPFASLGWFQRVSAWVREVITPLGLQLTEGFQQWNAAPAFSLIRFSTDKGGIWFKAAGPPNNHELGLTRELSSFSPQHSVSFLAEKPEWNAWIAREAEGIPLEEISDGKGWMLAAQSLARLQIASVDRTSRLIGLGAADLRVRTLLELTAPFFRTASEWMLEQKQPAAPLGSEQMVRLEQQIHEVLEAMQKLGIPETLGHMDPNPGNVIVSPKQGCIYLDWAEGYVGYPFVSHEYLLLHYRRSGLEAAGERHLEEAYWRAWKPLVPCATLEKARRLTPLLGVFLFALHLFTKSRTNHLLDAESIGLLRSLTRRMQREADVLRQSPSQPPAI